MKEIQLIKKNSMMKVIVPSSLDAIDKVVSKIDQFVSDNSFKLDAFALKLVIHEGLTNAIKHGNKCIESQKVIVTVETKGDLFCIAIEDEGEGFDWRTALKKEHQEIEMPSGRGILLMKGYGFNPTYNEEGTTLFLTRKYDE